MLLREMFSPIGAPKDDQQEIDYLDDLKFFIDNDSKMLDQYFFPAVKRHREHRGNPQVFKVYIRPRDILFRQNESSYHWSQTSIRYYEKPGRRNENFC